MAMPNFLLGTASRRRMVALATSTALFILVDSGFNVIGPLWATSDLGLDNAEWAFLRSVSEFGGFVSILAFGMLAERLGSRWMSAIALVGAGLTLAGMSTGAGTVWLMAVLGAFLSIIYVSYNTLAQSVSSRRQSLANAIYRAAGASAAIVAPAVATHAGHMFGAYAPVLVAAAIVLGVAGLVIVFYSEPETTRDSSRSLAAALAVYRRGFTLRPLLSFIAVTRSFGVAVAAVGAFAALRFTRELGLGDQAFGLLCSIIAIGNLLAVLASGWVADRLGPSRLLGLAWTGCGVTAMTMGLSNSLVAVIAAYALFVPLQSMCSVPLSLWSSRIAEASGSDGPSQNAVFTVQKVFQSGVTMFAMALLGALEPVVGMATLIWCGGLLALPMAIVVTRLGAAHKI
ncbi:MAG: Major Facilitator Superfamily protein [Steroidobacteraceae bacterium]|nr:Major Facilitator Superfamily protein [Steroidobacteraceae bacterium]